MLHAILDSLRDAPDISTVEGRVGLLFEAFAGVVALPLGPAATAVPPQSRPNPETEERFGRQAFRAGQRLDIADVNGGAKRDHRGGVRRDHLAAAGLSP